MMVRLPWLLVSLLLLPAGSAFAGPGDPVEVELVHCEPAPDKGSSGPGYAAPGFGNDPQDRILKVRLAYHTKDTGDDVTGALGATDRIELCHVGASGVPVCPGTSPWLIWDRPSATGALPTMGQVADGDLDPGGICPAIPTDFDCNAAPECYWTGAACVALTPLEESTMDPSNTPDGVRVIDLPDAGTGPVDWQATTSLPFVFPKVNGLPATALAAAQANGACAPHRHLADVPALSPHFDVIGIDPTSQPLGPGFDVCTQGSRVRWGGKRANGTYGAPPPGTDVCVLPAQGSAVGEILLGLDEAQRTRVQAQLLATAKEKYAWRNGTRPGGWHPTHVFLGPHPGSGGQSAPGAFYMNVYAIQQIVLGATSTKLDPDVVSLSSHEYMHQLQGAWGREAPASYPHTTGNKMLGEAIAVAGDLGLCAQNVGLPGLPADCTSGWKLGQTGRGIYGSARFMLANPGLNLIYPEPLDAQGKPKLNPYAIGLVLLYAQDQFAHPLLTTAHPAGLSSFLPHGSDSVPLRDRASDEGVDFLGLLFEEASLAPAGWSTEAVLDSALIRALGRSLDEILLDLHTALFLKDYSDSDPRWRFTWTHKDARTQPVPLSSGKPFGVPPDLYGNTCSCYAGEPGCTAPVCDGLTRAKRALDSWSLDPTGAVVPSLLPGGATVSGAMEPLGPHGAALFSVFPHPDWWGDSIKVSVTRRSGALPVFRIFRIDQLGPSNLTPVPICGSYPLHECKPVTSGADYGFTVHVPVSSATREVLLLASALSTGGKFDWSFSPSKLTIASAQQQGDVQLWMGNGVQSAAIPIKLLVADTDVKAIVPKPHIGLSVPGCGLASCDLGAADFGLLGLVDGRQQLLLTLPPGFAPSVPAEGMLDLEVTIAETSPLVLVDALRYGQALPLHATVLALDVGTSMETGIKLDALAQASRALVQSLAPPDPADPPDHFLSLVTFADDADTLVPLTGVDARGLATLLAGIDAISPGGNTSVGDGVLEAQSVLATAYDALLPLQRPHGQGVVLVADIGNSAAEPPSTYYQSASAPSEDGNGPPWYAGPLTRPARTEAGLPLPVVATVAVGPDADDGGLDALARTGGGLHLQVAAGDTTMSEADLVTSLADALGAGLARAAGYARIVALRSSGPGEGDVVVPVEPGATELRIWLASSLVDGAQATLVAPSGTPRAVSALAADGSYATYRVRDPEPGDWLLTLATTGPEPHVFVEATLRGGVGFSVAAGTEFADEPPAPPTPYETGAWVGSDVLLRAALRGDGPLLDCDVEATVQDPAGNLFALTLEDTGEAGDLGFGDGVHGKRFPRTSAPGTYVASVRASCPPQAASLGYPVVRETRADFTLRAAPDVDADLLPDVWETRQGLDPRDPADALLDVDADGLDALAELALGTSPQDDDSDRGGESDASEASRGGDPRDPRDDAIVAPAVAATPGNGMVYLEYGTDTTGLDMVVERATAPSGPFTPVAGVGGQGATFGQETGLANGEVACYRARLEGAGLESAWSTPRCVTPAPDPVAPELLLAGPVTRSSTGAVTIPLRVEEPEEHGGPGPLVDLGTAPGPPDTELRWWLVGDPEPVDGWEGFSELLALTVPAGASSVNVQVRDGAGNSSSVLPVSIAPLWPPCGDLDDDGRLAPADAALLRAHLADDAPGVLPPGALDRCAVIGAATDCDLLTSVVLRRQVEGFGLDPALDPVCTAATLP